MRVNTQWQPLVGRFEFVRVDVKFVPDISQNHRDWQSEDEECTETATAVVLETCQRNNNNNNSNNNNNNNSNGANNNNNGKSINWINCPTSESSLPAAIFFFL